MCTQSKILVLALGVVIIEKLIYFILETKGFLIYALLTIIFTALSLFFIKITYKLINDGEEKQELMYIVNNEKIEYQLQIFSLLLIDVFCIAFSFILAFSFDDLIDKPSNINIVLSTSPIMIIGGIWLIAGGIWFLFGAYTFFKRDIDKTNKTIKALKERIPNSGTLKGLYYKSWIYTLESNIELHKNNKIKILFTLFASLFGILGIIIGILVPVGFYMDNAAIEFQDRYNYSIQNKSNSYIINRYDCSIFDIKRHYNDEGVRYTYHTGDNNIILETYKDSKFTNELSDFALQFKSVTNKVSVNQIIEVMSIFLYTINQDNLDSSRTIIKNLFNKRNIFSDNNFRYELDTKQMNDNNYQITLIIRKKVYSQYNQEPKIENYDVNQNNQQSNTENLTNNLNNKIQQNQSKKVPTKQVDDNKKQEIFIGNSNVTGRDCYLLTESIRVNNDKSVSCKIKMVKSKNDVKYLEYKFYGRGLMQFTTNEGFSGKVDAKETPIEYNTIMNIKKLNKE